MALGRLPEITPVVSGEGAGKPSFFEGSRKRWGLLVQRIEQLSRSFSRHITVYATSLVINEIGADVDFRVEGVDEPNLLFTDASTGRVGIGTATPSRNLHVKSSGSANMEIQGDSVGLILTDDGGPVDEKKTQAFVDASKWRLRGVNDDFTSETVTGIALDLSTGDVGVNTNSPTEALDVNADAIRIRTASTPASASATGAVGEIRWDSSFIYVAIATDTWKRVAISTW